MTASCDDIDLPEPFCASSRCSSRGSSPGRSRRSSHLSSSSSTASQYVGSPDYRRINLRTAGIFIHVMAEDEWPSHVRSFIDTLTRDLEFEVITALKVEASSSLVNPLRDTVTALAKQARQYVPQNKSAWMDFHKRVLDVFSDDSLERIGDQRFDVQVGPTSDSGAHLYTPSPDLAFGLATTVPRPGQPRTPLDGGFLEDVTSVRGVQPYPSPSAPWRMPAFPCVILEAVSVFESIFKAENRVANGAAKLLAMLQTLTDSYNQVVGVQTSPNLPTIGICSMGSYYNVFVVFDLRSASQTSGDGDGAFLYPGIHLIQIWSGDVHHESSMMQLQLLLQRISRWIHSTWRPTIIGMLSTIQADIANSATR